MQPDCPTHQLCAKTTPTLPSFQERAATGQVLLSSARMGDAKHILDDLTATFAHVLPVGLTREVEKNLRAALQATLARLDLVTREELEVQEQVLARTRARLQEMEKKLVELEERLKKQ